MEVTVNWETDNRGPTVESKTNKQTKLFIYIEERHKKMYTFQITKSFIQSNLCLKKNNSKQTACAIITDGIPSLFLSLPHQSSILINIGNFFLSIIAEPKTIIKRATDSNLFHYLLSLHLCFFFICAFLHNNSTTMRAH